MKRELAAGGLIMLALGVVAGAVRALDLLGSETLRTLALILALPLGVAIMALGLTPLVKAWRAPTTPPVERNVVRETRLHTIDNRGSLHGARVRQIELYPGLHSAAWRAGPLDDKRSEGRVGWEVDAAECGKQDASPDTLE